MLRAQMCRLLIAERQIVERFLGATLGANPYWDILLDLYLAEYERRLVYQSCLAPSAPPAKAHRQSARLSKLGAVERALDEADHRRMNVTLSPDTRQALDMIMDLLAPTWLTGQT
ncbi:MAG: MarR family transcriptional regulator [Sphingomonas sp.]|nr:MarR family transcriptional regulator [Sphingomonas sp.]